MRRFLVAVLVAIGLMASPAHASLGVEMPLTHWYPSFAGNALKQTYYMSGDVVPKRGQLQPAHYAATDFWTQNGSVGYFGLQQLEPVHGDRQKRLIFSWWGANGVYCSGSTVAVYHCDTFDEFGTGYAVHAAFNWQPHRHYEFQLINRHGDALGQWWDLHVVEETTIRHIVGSIRVPYSFGGINFVRNWIEWFSQSEVTDCSQVPLMHVWRSPITLNDQLITNHANDVVNREQPCAVAQVFDWNGGVVQKMGT